MKKQLVASLAASFVLGIAGTAFAANPFVDVPRQHWSYDAVNKLAQAGIIDGYADGTFKGDKTITRYEMAQIVAKAMAKEDKANAEQKAVIQKLEVEFAQELEGLNVRVSNLEKNADKIKFNGEYRIRYDHKKPDGKDATTETKGYVDFIATAKVNDDWKVVMEFEDERNYNNDSYDKDANGNDTLNKSQITKAYATGPVAGTTAKFGRIPLFSNQGLLFDTKYNGAEFSFGNVVKTNVYYGRPDQTDVVKYTTNTNTSEAFKTYAAVDFAYDISKKVNVSAAYHQLKPYDGDNVHIWELGTKVKLSDQFALVGDYAKSNADNDNKAYVVSLNYKGADINTVGSYGAALSYIELQNNAAPHTTYYVDLGNKAYQAEYYYVPAKNIKLGVTYIDEKLVNDSDQKTKKYRGQVEFFF